MMKRILTAALLALLAFEAGAQSWVDAVNFTDNDYLGTARSLGMGNAMTAVGGDLGSLTLNPAGSAVATYSQFTITPGLSVSTVVGQGTTLNGADFGFEYRDRNNMTRMNMPNVGAVMVYDTHNRSGLKRVSFGVVGNMTRDFTNRLRAHGTNSETSLAGSLASQADGYTESVLNGSFWQSNIPSWETMVGYQGGIFDPIVSGGTGYYGLTERVLDNGNIVLADKIGQYYGLERKGFKYDILMNLGLDFNDRFYVGANIGITSLSYRSDETRSEEALSSGNYPTGFQNLRVRSAYRDDADGIYAKIGFIARPVDGLRIGAAIQTPTLFTVSETYALEGYSKADDIQMSASSPTDDWYYNLKTPFRVNAGVAYTIGKVALVSADYEYCNYRQMRFSASYDEDYYYDFSDTNMDIKDITGAVHAFRVGGEIKAAPELALRVGYNLTTGAQYNWLNDDFTVDPLNSEERLAQLKHAVTFGVGYSSPGSFFADLAVRFLFLPDEYTIPYYYYGVDNNGNTYKNTAILTPEICAQSSLCNVLMTLGWRF